MKNLIIIFILIFFTACTPRYQAGGITQYRVESVERKDFGATVKLTGVRGSWDVLTDTIKVGDTIPVSWVKRIR